MLSLLLVLLLALALLVVLAAFLVAQLLLRPPRMTDSKASWVLKRLSPGDLGMKFQSRSFFVRDEHTGRNLKMAAWWIPCENANGRCAIFVHGYADAKVGAIAWAPLFQSLGWNILAYDLRAHGDSEGKYVTAGVYERHDLNQVIDQIRAERPAETRQIILVGLSVGAAVACGAAVLRDDLSGVMLDSPSGDEGHAVEGQLVLMGFPWRWFHRVVEWFAYRLTGADLWKMRPIDLIPRIRCPLMVVQPGRDIYVPPEDAAALERAATSRDSRWPTVHWRVDDVSHLMALAGHPDEYRERLGAFLDMCTRPEAASRID